MQASIEGPETNNALAQQSERLVDPRRDTAVGSDDESFLDGAAPDLHGDLVGNRKVS